MKMKIVNKRFNNTRKRSLALVHSREGGRYIPPSLFTVYGNRNSTLKLCSRDGL